MDDFSMGNTSITFLQNTTFDFVNKDRTGNPYKFAASKAYSGDRTLDGELLTTFFLRAYYYIATNSSSWVDGLSEAASFGKLEALNVFKAVRDKYSDGFVEFIKTCFGEETLEENLDFIANAFSKSNKSSREKIREYINILLKQKKNHLKVILIYRIYLYI